MLEFIKKPIRTAWAIGAFAVLLTAWANPVWASTYIVTNLNDSGWGSLREAMDKANNRPGNDVILFRVSGTITLASTLPAITDRAGLTIDGYNRIAISGNGSDLPPHTGVRPFMVNPNGKLNLQNVSVTKGSGYELGCGSLFYGGGAICNEGTLVISNSTISQNFGVGIYNASTLTVDKSAVNGNIRRFPVDGGGIVNHGTASITNSTFSENGVHCKGGCRGGAIANWGTLTIRSSTFVGNYANAREGGAIYNAGTLNMANTVLYSSSDGYAIPDCVGTITSSVGNWIGNGGCGYPAAGDPLLGPLADNGGPTLTNALLPGSPAIDAADDRLCARYPANGVDQRGIKRPQGWHCDIGAFEASAEEFSGFKPPVGNPPALNEVRAGEFVPMKFDFDGHRGHRGSDHDKDGHCDDRHDAHGQSDGCMFQPSYPLSKQIDCTNDQVMDGTAVPSNGQLTDKRNQFTYYWKTERAWAGTCRRFQILFVDGSFGQANFTFK